MWNDDPQIVYLTISDYWMDDVVVDSAKTVEITKFIELIATEAHDQLNKM